MCWRCSRLRRWLACSSERPLVYKKKRGRSSEQCRGGPVIPLAATALVMALMTTLVWREIAAKLVVVAFAAITYLLSQRRRAMKQTPSDIATA